MIVFTPAEVANLNAYQQCGLVHPYTCPVDSCRADLEARAEGWYCGTCQRIVQTWAHGFVKSKDWRDYTARVEAAIGGPIP